MLAVKPGHRHIGADPRAERREQDINRARRVADGRNRGEQVPHRAPVGGADRWREATAAVKKTASVTIVAPNAADAISGLIETFAIMVSIFIVFSPLLPSNEAL
jgi:hypothetical protein